MFSLFICNKPPLKYEYVMYGEESLYMIRKLLVSVLVVVLQSYFVESSCFAFSSDFKTLEKCHTCCCCKAGVCKCGHSAHSKGKSSESKRTMCKCSSVPYQEKSANLSSPSNTDVQKQLKSNPILISLECNNNSPPGYLFHNLSPCRSNSHSIPLRI